MSNSSVYRHIPWGLPIQGRTWCIQLEAGYIGGSAGAMDNNRDCLHATLFSFRTDKRQRDARGPCARHSGSRSHDILQQTRHIGHWSIWGRGPPRGLKARHFNNEEKRENPLRIFRNGLRPTSIIAITEEHPTPWACSAVSMVTAPKHLSAWNCTPIRTTIWWASH